MCLCIIVLLLLISCNRSEQHSINGPIQKALANEDRSDYDSSRDIQRKAESILALAAIKPGMKIADLDAGSGYYSELFSYLVGDKGKVYLQNTQRYVKNHSDKIEKRLVNNRLPNVIRLDSSFNDLQLPNGLDLIFIGLAFHDIYVPQHQEDWNANPQLYIQQLYNSLVDGGRLLIIDHASNDDPQNKTPELLHRINEDFAIKSIESVGFKFVLSSDILRNPSDDRSLIIWDKKSYRKTDRFVLLFQK